LPLLTLVALLASWPASGLAHAAGTRVKNNAIAASPVKNHAWLVDTRTWTSGGGNTFPGADVPFGMVQWSPDTMPDRSDGGGYTYGSTASRSRSSTCHSRRSLRALRSTG
jgi:putative alpha-1,2-mannosidase